MSKKEVNEANRAERQREHDDQLRINEEIQRAAKESAQKAISDREASQLARDESLTSTLPLKP